MDLNRVSNDKQLVLCQWYFRGELSSPNRCSNVILRHFDSVFLYHFSWLSPSSLRLADQRNLVLRLSLQEAAVR